MNQEHWWGIEFKPDPDVDVEKGLAEIEELVKNYEAKEGITL